MVNRPMIHIAINNNLMTLCSNQTKYRQLMSIKGYKEGQQKLAQNQENKHIQDLISLR